MLLAALLAVATFVVWLPARENGFVDYDDGAYVVQNPDVNAGLTVEGVRWAVTAFHSANWHPLTWLSHMLDCELFGLDPAGHHLTGIALHALATALAFLAFAALTGRAGASLVVALLFGLHPLRVESVAWVSERKDVLSGAFFFATLLAYARYVRRPGKGRYALVAALFAVGLLAKQMLVTLPVLLLLLDRWPLGRWSGAGARRLVLEKLPLLALAGAAGAATLLAQRAGDAVRSVESLPLDARVANAFVALLAYPAKTLWPTDLAAFYPHPGLVAPETFSPTGARVLGAAAVAVAASALVVVLRRRRPELFVGWWWYVLTLLPVIGILQVGAQWMADRYAYLTTVGLYAGVVYALDASLGARGRRAALAVGIALAAACIPATRAQIEVWRDTRSLFEHALAVTERNYVAHINLGLIENREANLDAAEAHYRAALEVAPRMTDAHSNLGSVLMLRGRLDDARHHLERALELDPRYTNARLLLGLLARTAGRPDEALHHYREAVRRDPGSVLARLELASALARGGEDDEALALLRETVERQPNHALARVRLGEALARAGAPREARDHLESAAARASSPVEAREALVWLLATSKDEGVRDPARAFRIARDLPNTWSSLRARSAAYASVGEFDTAYKLALEATEHAPREAKDELIDMVRRFKAEEALRR